MTLFIFLELECLDEKCLAREKNVLIDLLEQLRKEISSCEIIESDVKLEYEVKSLFNICENCSACIQEVRSKNRIKKLENLNWNFSKKNSIMFFMISQQRKC